ncbi:glucosamine-6-phosphate deaminase [Xinfangfangia sp. D13-10-4-6]|uniref:glucosamine-6-phosphate deaminase n=1 Tax=Pseudogemmobacter hezensis TaxID=2737662 RepID=UPI0015539B5F|nr:glucosamine-6-phosphate deaminase [Pseudogemmobacter hezensis]NPD16021.1 glucosamine-6-phosphate deaminase [Pseudogemmobacter hezensis]
MKVLILPDAGAAADRTADLLSAQLRAMPSSVLGLATGGTMEAVYARLVRLHREEGLSFARASSFNLDEYVGLPPDHPCSYWHYMRQQLFDHVDIDLANAHLPQGDAADPEAEAIRYEAAISDAGQIDLQLLGLGLNGHIGFNEPTSSLNSATRIKTLTRSTRDANARFFTRPEDVPQYAITMGIGTILRAAEVVLLAYGAAKAGVVAQMIEGPVTASCPASVLQMHQKATVVIDESAASQLRLRDYYELVHPAGGEAGL